MPSASLSYGVITLVRTSVCFWPKAAGRGYSNGGFHGAMQRTAAIGQKQPFPAAQLHWWFGAIDQTEVDCMGPKAAQLVETLDEIVALLRSDGEQHWSEYIDDCRSHLMADDYYGIEKLLRSYGGMGSFNDIVVGYESATGRWKPKSDAQNGELNLLRSRAYELAEEIRRGVHAGGN